MKLNTCLVLSLDLSGCSLVSKKHMSSKYFHFSIPFISATFKTSNLFFFDHHPEQKLNLIYAETWPAGRSCLWDDIHRVEKYRPPLAPMHILSFTAAISLLSCGQPKWHHPLNYSSKTYLLTPVKWKISNKSDNLAGPVVTKHQDFIIILGGNDISHQNRTSLSLTAIIKDAHKGRWHK